METGRHHAGRHHSRLHRVTHALTAKRINHAGSIANRDEPAGQFIVCERSRHEAVGPGGISRYGILPDKKAEIRALVFDRHAASVTILKKRELHNGSARPRLNILHAELFNASSFRESAEFAGRVDDRGAVDSIHYKAVVRLSDVLNPPAFYYSGAARENPVERAARNAKARTFKRNV